MWFNRILYSLPVAIFEFLLVWYFKFSFWAVIVLFALLGGLMYLLEHRNFAWNIIIGTIVFGLGLSLFGWMIMEGWDKPQDFFSKH